MIRLKNTSNDTLQIHDAGDGWFRYLRPGHEGEFKMLDRSQLIVERSYTRTMDPRFDPRGGDPYNRVGSRAVP